jgi:fatty-acyl-CoA synthase
MQETPLTVASLLRHGERTYPTSEVVTCGADGSTRRTFWETAGRAAQLAHALAELGVGRSDRVATFMWNNQVHLEAYLAVPAMGAVLHTLNIRLGTDQVRWIAAHAEDQVVIVDADLLPLLEPALEGVTSVRRVIVCGDDYEELIAGRPTTYEWLDDLDERSAAALCYTSGTTGDPKGVAYSHRSLYLHSLGVLAGNVYAMTEHDRVLPVVPMFHANAWGIPYAAWLSGADLLMPGPHLSSPRLPDFMAGERCTVSAGVPTVWNDLLLHAETHEVNLSTVRMLVAGGSAVPVAMMQRFRERLGVDLVQGWGMTETSPVAAVARPPKGAAPEEEWRWRGHTGRVVAGVSCRIVDDDGVELPRDGVAVGEFQCRGPWVTAGYHRVDDTDRFADGWLRTGDVGTLDERGFMQIKDRAKDLIKSGGEWISSVTLETALVAHPSVHEAAVIAIPDEKWQERPLAVIVWREAAERDYADLCRHLLDHVPRWQVPESWAAAETIPRTSVGKFDKKVMRTVFADGGYELVASTRDESEN